MPTITIYNQQGQEIGQAELPSEIFAVPMNFDLVHQAVVTQMTNARQPIAHTKDRGQVRGGGGKPWPQKGTGRARHGSIRSPIWIGGGVTFGPTKERVFAKKINKKMKRKALLMALSSKVRDGELILLDKLEIAEAKTKKIIEILNKLKSQILKLKTTTQKPKLSFLIVLPKSDLNVIRAAKNIPQVATIGADSLNVVDVLRYKYLLIPQEAIKMIQKTYLKAS